MRNSNNFRRRRFGSTQSRPRQTPPSRISYESHGPNGSKVRGMPAQVSERYVQFAREVASSDRILMEAYLQYAENYLRLGRGDYDVSGGAIFKIRRFDERIDNPDGIVERESPANGSDSSDDLVSEEILSKAGVKSNRQRRGRTVPQVKRTGLNLNEDTPASSPESEFDPGIQDGQPSSGVSADNA